MEETIQKRSDSTEQICTITSQMMAGFRGENTGATYCLGFLLWSLGEGGLVAEGA